MKLEQNEKQLLFSETVIPDIFFTEFLPEIPGDYLKIYLYLNFLAKYKKDVKLNDLSKKLSLPLKTLNEGLKFLEDYNLILKKATGFIVNDLQELTLNNLYKPNLTQSKEKIEQTAKNQSRAKVIEYINNMYFQGIMGPSWYNDIDLWFRKYNFDEQVMISLFNYCYNRSALHKNYVQTVAEAWHSNKVQTYNDLDLYYQKQEKLNKIKSLIAKKLGKHGGLTQYEEAYIISDWHDRNLKTPDQVNAFLEQRKKQSKDLKDMKAQVSKANYEQRQYNNLDFLYANNETNNNEGDN